MRGNRKRTVAARRFFAMALAIVLTWSSVPMSASAEEVSNSTTASETIQVSENAPIMDSEPETTTYQLEDGIADSEKTKTYSTTGTPFDMTVIKAGIAVYANDELYGVLSDALLTDKYTLTWKQQEGDDYVAMAQDASPVDAGNYILAVSLSMTGEGEDASLEIPFVINKISVNPSAWKTNSLVSGLMVKEQDFISSFKVSVLGETLTYVKDSASTADVNEAEDSDLAISVDIRDMMTGEVLSEDTVITTYDYYEVTVNVSFTDNVSEEIRKNYKVASQVKTNVTVATSSSTLKANLLEPWLTDGYISKIYDKTAMAVPVEGEDYETQITLYSGSIAGGDSVQAQITGQWTDSKGNVMDEAPVNVGTYYYKLTLSAKDGLYNAGECTITVKILPRELVIKPRLKAGTTVYSKMTVGEVIKQSVEYVVWDVLADKELEIDQQTFWGTEDSGANYYMPRFYIYQKSGEKWYQQGDTSAFSDAYTYQLRFAGQKIMYVPDGYRSVSMTYGDCPELQNYEVKTDSTTLTENYDEFSVQAIQKATIDVSALFREELGTTNGKAFQKEYDEKPFMEKASDYQKAVVNLADVSGNITKLAEGDDAQIKYSWDRRSGAYWNAYSCDTASPVNAGQYRLRVSFDCATNEYIADDQFVYYTILPKNMKIVPKGSYEAWTKTAVNNFDTEQIVYEMYYIPTEGEPVKLAWEAEDYTILWQIQRADAAAEEKVYSSAAGTDFDAAYDYRIVASSISFSDNEYKGNYAISATAGVEYAPIAIKVMGDTEITFVTDGDALSESVKEYDGEAFDISEALENGLVQVKKADGGEVVEGLALEYTWYDSKKNVVESPIAVGVYELYVSYPGDETYNAQEAYVTTVEITKRTVTVSLNQKANIYGGTTVGIIRDSLTDYFEIRYDNMAPVGMEDKLFSSLYANIYNANGGTLGASTVLATTVDYTVKGAFTLNSKYASCYEVVYNGVTITPELMPSEVLAATIEAGDQTWPEVLLTDTVNGLEHTISFVEAIPYVGEWGTNYISLVITANSELNFNSSGVLYEKSIEKIGGSSKLLNNKNLQVWIPATELTDKEFSIYWKSGVVEKFIVKFSEAQLLPDLTEAVSPKSISFISPVKKMAVGTFQQLDVKYTKQQENDIISLGYQSSDPDVLTVDKYGKVYALAAGKADIIVYAAKMVDGEMVAIEGGKSAKVSITVSGLTAPKLTTTAYDTAVDVKWNNPSDNAIYEIYVLEGKNRKAVDFEQAIEAYRTGTWNEGFATEPLFSQTAESVQVGGLKPVTDYTVCVVSKSVVYKANRYVYGEYTAMSVKSFKTIKSMVQALEVSFAEADAEWNEELSCYVMPYGSQKVKVNVAGCFEKPTTGEIINNELPLSKELQKTYQNPKLTYSIISGSSVAAIDKKGNLKLKAVGRFAVCVKDSLSGCSDTVWVKVEAAPTAVKGKNVKLQVGQSIALEELLIYQQGKSALSGDVEKSVLVDDALIQAFADNTNFVLDAENKMVTAVKAGGKLQVKLTDEKIAAAGGSATADVTLQSQAMAAVKNLQIKNVTDTYFDVQFKQGGYAETYKVVITDSRGKVVRSVALNGMYLYNDKLDCYSYRVYGLYQRTKYNVTVTAVYGDESSKPAKKSVTTTKMPASYVVLEDATKEWLYDSEEEYLAACWGGVAVRIRNGNNCFALLNSTNSGYNTLAANGSYIIELWGEKLNEGAIAAGTDTLTWSSSNSKIAKISANKGTAAATLTAFKSGETVIEVKSKITKAVVARFKIKVEPVGDGNVYYNGKGFERLLVNTTESVRFEAGEGVWLVFQAPVSGTYRIVSQNYSAGDPQLYYFKEYPDTLCITAKDFANASDARNDNSSNYDFALSVPLVAGQVVYFFVTDSGMDNAAEYQVCITRTI